MFDVNPLSHKLYLRDIDRQFAEKGNLRPARTAARRVQMPRFWWRMAGLSAAIAALAVGLPL